jgi:hypothetical protein
LVDFSMTLVNIGTLQLKNFTLMAPERVASAGNCSTPNSDNILDPGAAITCTASVNVSTADIEAGIRSFTVGAAATSVLGFDITRVHDVALTPVQLPELSVAVLDCKEVPTLPGMLAPSHAIHVYMRTCRYTT